MTLEQLKERIEATCNKNGIFLNKLEVENFGLELKVYFACNDWSNDFEHSMPSCDLLIEAVDLECRAIKARQSSATNGIDE